MAVDVNKKHATIAYLSDSGITYAVRTNRAHALAVSGTAPPSGASGYPRGWTPRKIHAISSDGLQKIALVCPGPGTAPFQFPVGATVTVPGMGTFAVTGATGEKRPNPAPPL